MGIFQVVGIGLITTVLAVVLRGPKPELATLLSLAAGALLLLAVLPPLGEVVMTLAGLSREVHLNFQYLGTILKIIGISYLVGFGAQIARDAGERALAEKMELAGKVAVMVMAIPVMLAVLESVARLIP